MIDGNDHDEEMVDEFALHDIDTEFVEGRKITLKSDGSYWHADHKLIPPYNDELMASIEKVFGARMLERAMATPRPIDLPYVSQLLNKSATIFAERNAVYKDNFRMVGNLMMAMFPKGPPRLQSAEDYNRWHLFELAIVKLSRYVTNYDAGGHEDSMDDLIVYMAMVAALDKEAGNRKT